MKEPPFCRHFAVIVVVYDAREGGSIGRIGRRSLAFIDSEAWRALEANHARSTTAIAGVFRGRAYEKEMP